MKLISYEGSSLPALSGDDGGGAPGTVGSELYRLVAANRCRGTVERRRIDAPRDAVVVKLV